MWSTDVTVVEETPLHTVAALRERHAVMLEEISFLTI